MRNHPHLYEANALVFLRRLSREHHRRLTLSSVPAEEWRRLRLMGFDLLWLMGVWERSPAGCGVALNHPGLRTDYDRALPGWTGGDVAGSPYCVYDYRLDRNLGTEGDLALLKETLNREGLGLVLDFVPNHLALDHPWTVSHPQRFVVGTPELVRAHPEWFFSTASGVHLAHGRDPYFPPWTDTVQVNFFSPDTRQALVAELLRIARVADGVRCDMAMLGLNDVFQQVWGEAVRDLHRPAGEFWSEAIARVKEQYPDFLFVAEAYWDLEATLLDLGFDYAYDKALYDNLRYHGPAEVRSHVHAAVAGNGRWVRFIENHDEDRAVAALGKEKSLAAAVVMATLPGLRFFHDGQLEGKRIRLPVQLGREPQEEPDPEVLSFYRRLLEIIDSPVLHDGQWSPLAARPAWSGDPSYHNLLAWTWEHGPRCKLVVVNYAPVQSQGRLSLTRPRPSIGNVALRDELTDTLYLRDADELQRQGLYVELGPWKSHILDVTPD
jgi:glycosidase